MNVELLAHTQLSRKFVDKLKAELDFAMPFTSGKAIALTAIRTCYSPGKPSEIVINEGEKYFGTKATDGKEGSEADRLIRMIIASKHTSTLEGISFVFAVEDVSRALLAQLTRHRVGFSFSVQSQRYVKFGSNDRSGGFDFVTPDSIGDNEIPNYQYAVEFDDDYEVTEWKNYTAEEVFEEFMRTAQVTYDRLRKAGVPAEDARAVLPNAAATSLVLTVNLRALLDFYSKRKPGAGGQKEITDLAEELKAAVIEVEPWTEAFFN
ncbi:FAD-dependent thymidylate synthase [Neobacillus niacini]|uniref:FAD-dependent thymidylate synthase n=1 Tax=Neobacillus niacini TaxID=86668 RepID=UPI00285C4823|nr:FAD-dependent thymidylate synthase [Neobacillus niacini]MDR7001589.1 thymidylate synthase (FAD) [Neobacillus niacini]